tara:strand:- start:71 stop:235 length:165 start_codon:yes stop_codon:yes gene_type:complete
MFMDSTEEELEFLRAEMLAVETHLKRCRTSGDERDHHVIDIQRMDKKACRYLQS